MKESQMSMHSSLRKLSFVHNALPELSLGEVDTSFNLGKEKVKLKFPLLVLFSDRTEAMKESSARKDVPAAVMDGRSVEVFLNGSSHKVALDGYKMENVGDGIEVAKALRMDSSFIPFIEKSKLENFDLFIKQLRIAMFLTDSRDIKALRKAPIYTTG
ncbi:MAG: hypothetical protein LVQ95_04720 [Candidatus Micrarchaeales archaeon]|nr:hypothetical protein [Candidatus Micrarchaeales archaeon]